MNVIVGDNTGLLKYVSLRTNGIIKKMGTQKSERGGISAMCWAGLDNRESEVAIALTGGNIEVWNPATQSCTATMQGATIPDKETKIVGLHVLRMPQLDIKRRVVNVLSNGTANILPWLDTQVSELVIDESELEGLTTQQANAYKRKLETRHAKALLEQQQILESETVEFHLGRHIERTRLAPSNEILASGGKNNKVSLHDIETQTQIFRAKNLPNDWLNMEVPNWDMDFTFLTPGCAEPWTNSGKVDYKIAVSTGYNNVRIYDVKASRRPIMDENIGKHPARAIASTPDGMYVIVGDAAGRIQKLDTRMNLRQVGIFKGSCGSVREIQVHPTLPMVASVGLDRHLRIHDIDTRKCLKEVYLTQKLTGCLFSAMEPNKKLMKSSVTQKNNEDTEVWKQFDQIAKENDANSSSKKVATGTIAAVSSRSMKDTSDEDEDDDEDELEYEMEVESVRGTTAQKQKQKTSTAAPAATTVTSMRSRKYIEVESDDDDDEEEEEVDEDGQDEDDDNQDDEDDEFGALYFDDEDEDLMMNGYEGEEDMEFDEDDDEDEEYFQPFTVGFKILGDDGSSVVAAGKKETNTITNTTKPTITTTTTTKPAPKQPTKPATPVTTTKTKTKTKEQITNVTKKQRK